MSKQNLAKLLCLLAAVISCIWLGVVILVQKSSDVTSYYVPGVIALLGICGAAVAAFVKLD